MFVVTGGGSGIGKALAHALALRKKNVLIIGRQQHTLNETAAFSPLIESLCADVSTQNGRASIEKRLLQEDTIQGLVHNAGTVEPILPITEISEAAWRNVMATNVEGPLFLNQLLSNKLVNGRVLNMGSAVAYFPVAGWSAYCTSKAALSMLNRCWQLECKDIAFSSVMPGIIDTNMQAQIRHTTGMDIEKQDFFKRLKQEKKLVSPETVALFLCWLLLDVDKEEYVLKEWDIYDQTHHQAWLIPPHIVPMWE